MGKRYYCEYCKKTMVATPNIIKTHLQGLVHQKIMNEHYQQFKDPEIILAEESVKKPCSRFPKGECQYGSVCRFTHYTPDQLSVLREMVAAKNGENSNQSQPSFEFLYNKLQEEKSKTPKKEEENTVLCDKNGLTHVLPWTYNSDLEKYGELPPSIKRFKVEDFINAKFETWG